MKDLDSIKDLTMDEKEKYDPVPIITLTSSTIHLYISFDNTIILNNPHLDSSSKIY